MSSSMSVSEILPKEESNDKRFQYTCIYKSLFAEIISTN